MVDRQSLRTVQQLLADPENWCQKRAQSKGRVCLSQAVCNICPQETIDFVSEQCRQRGFGGMADLNDKNDHTYVVEFLEECLS